MSTDSRHRSHTTTTQAENQTTADPSAGIQILGMPDELDLLTADGLVEQGRAAVARQARLLLHDLTGLSFCDVRARTRPRRASRPMSSMSGSTTGRT